MLHFDQSGAREQARSKLANQLRCHSTSKKGDVKEDFLRGAGPKKFRFHRVPVSLSLVQGVDKV